MAETQVIHLAWTTRHHELAGGTAWSLVSHLTQKNWINEKTSGYFTWHQNDQSGCLTENVQLSKKPDGKKPDTKWGLN